MGSCREWQRDSRKLARHRKATPSNRIRRWPRSTLRGLLGVDCKPLHGLSGLQTTSWGLGRIQRQVYVEPDDPARRILRHAGEPLTGNLPQFLSAGNTLAIHGNTFGRLRTLKYESYDRFSDIRNEKLRPQPGPNGRTRGADRRGLARSAQTSTISGSMDALRLRRFTSFRVHYNPS